MNMKNDLINSINTKVSAPDMKYSELITSGANTLDEAFKPYKNTNEMVTLDRHLYDIKALQAKKMEALATQEQNKMAIDQINETFKIKEKEVNEIGANLFTDGGTNLNGTEETFKQNIIIDFEKETGKTGFTIDDLKRNVDSSQLSMSEGLKERIKKLADYEYKKAKVDNRILDNSELDELANNNYDKYAIIGQDRKTFRDIFVNNSNSIQDVILDKQNKKRLEELLSDKDLEKERLLKQMENEQKEINRIKNALNGNNNQNNVSQNTGTNSNTNKINSNNNVNNNKDTNKNTNEDTNDNQFIIDDMNRKALIQHHTDREKINSNLLNTDDKIKEGYELIKNGDPNLQRAMVQNLIKNSGISKLFDNNGKLSHEIEVPSYMDNPVGIITGGKRKIRSYFGDEFISDLLLNADSGYILHMRLDQYAEKLKFMPKEVVEVYKTIEKLQHIEAKKYNHIIDKTKDIANDVNLMTNSNAKTTGTSKEINTEYEKYVSDGELLKNKDEKLENNIAITNDGIFQTNNGADLGWVQSLTGRGLNTFEETRNLHANKLDDRYIMSNNILNRLYGNSYLMPEIVYFLSTSDSVIEVRDKYFSTPDKTKITTKMFKNPKESLKLINEMRDALDMAKKNLNLPEGTNTPKLADLAKMIFLVDLSIMPNYDHFYENSASLGKVYATIQNNINPNNLANLSNNSKEYKMTFFEKTF